MHESDQHGLLFNHTLSLSTWSQIIHWIFYDTISRALRLKLRWKLDVTVSQLPFYSFISLFICITCSMHGTYIRLILNAIPLVSFVEYNLIGVCHFHLCVYALLRLWLIPYAIYSGKTKLHSEEHALCHYLEGDSF